MLKLGSICFLMRKKSLSECLETIITKPEKPKLASSGEESVYERQQNSLSLEIDFIGYQ